VFRVQVHPKDGSSVVLTVSVQAESWQDAVRRALRGLGNALEPADRGALTNSEFRVIDPATGHHYIVRSMAELQAQSMRTSEASADLAEKDPLDWGEEGSIPQKPRPVDDVLKTVDNPRGWRSKVDLNPMQRSPQIRSDTLKPVDRTPERNSANRVFRGQFARVVGWTTPSSEVNEIVAKAVDMTWDHIPCETVQCFIPIEDSHCFSVVAARGEPGPTIVKSRIELPEELSELASMETEPVAILAEDLRLIYEHHSGAIVSHTATAILWVPVVALGEMIAILLAINPKKTVEFTDGDLNGAVYLAETLAKQLRP
jgi:hypothetical protein